MEKFKKNSIKIIRYLFLISVFTLGLTAIFGTGGDNEECDLPGPITLSDSIANDEVSFSWSYVENADSYHIRVGTKANLTEIPPGDGCPGTSLEIDPECIERWTSDTSSQEDLSGVPYGTYYWAVIPVCENGERGYWSYIESFDYTVQ